MKTILLAKSSSGEPYDVTFSAEGGLLRVTCSCKAGVLQQRCKHKLALMNGDSEMLFDPSQAKLLHEIQAWPQYCELLQHLSKEEDSLASIEKQRAKLSAEEKFVKSRVGKLLAHGTL